MARSSLRKDHPGWGRTLGTRNSPRSNSGRKPRIKVQTDCFPLEVCRSLDGTDSFVQFVPRSSDAEQASEASGLDPQSLLRSRTSSPEDDMEEASQASLLADYEDTLRSEFDTSYPDEMEVEQNGDLRMTQDQVGHHDSPSPGPTEVSLDQLLDEIRSEDGSTWGVFQQRLLACLDPANEPRLTSSLSQAPLDFEIADTPLHRLFSVVASMTHDVSKIPAERWAIYKAALVKFCDAYEITTMNFRQRLTRLGQILYLPEELEALRSNNWEVMQAVISLVAVIAEVTGPIDEPMNPRLAEKWAMGKQADVTWLKKFFAVKERIYHLRRTDAAAQTESM
ncbi:hypothetical protein S40293_09313 [Stachybotrys chartarum IBT 40293]|nr:hypothetical protein S40293_09313 [Stachybotrys chartarum IBT 40293]